MPLHSNDAHVLVRRPLEVAELLLAGLIGPRTPQQRVLALEMLETLAIGRGGE